MKLPPLFDKLSQITHRGQLFIPILNGKEVFPLPICKGLVDLSELGLDFVQTSGTNFDPRQSVDPTSYFFCDWKILWIPATKRLESSQFQLKLLCWEEVDYVLESLFKPSGGVDHCCFQWEVASPAS